MLEGLSKDPREVLDNCSSMIVAAKAACSEIGPVAARWLSKTKSKGKADDDSSAATAFVSLFLAALWLTCSALSSGLELAQLRERPNFQGILWL